MKRQRETHKPWSMLVALSMLTACGDFDQLHNPGFQQAVGAGGAMQTSTAGAGGDADARDDRETTATASGTGTPAGTGTAGTGTVSGTGTAAGTSTASGGATAAGGATATGTAGGGGGSATGGAGGATAAGAGGGSIDAAIDASVDAAGGGSDASPDGSRCAGYALQFNGTSAYATINRSIQDDFTIEAWIKPTATLPVLTGTNLWNGYGLVYADVRSTTNDFGMALLNGKFAFGIGNPDSNVQSTSSIANGSWTHVAATRNMATGEIQVIVNGALDGTQASTQRGALSAPTEITIGANTIDGHYFAGVIDELRLWNVVRSPAQIAAGMGQRLTGTEAGLVGYYRFDDASGATATDGSATRSNGILASTAGATGLPVWIASDAPLCP